MITTPKNPAKIAPHVRPMTRSRKMIQPKRALNKGMIANITSVLATVV